MAKNKNPKGKMSNSNRNKRKGMWKGKPVVNKN